MIEHARGEDVAAHHRLSRGGILGLGFLDDAGHPVHLAGTRFGADDAVLARVLARHVHRAQHRTAVVVVHAHHLLHHRGAVAVVQQVVGEQHREGLVVTHHRRRAQHGVAEAECLGLADVDAVHALGHGLADHLEHRRLALGLQLGLELVGLVEVILDRALGAAGDEDHVGDPRRHRLLHRVLDQRPVDDGQHLLGTRLGGRQEARTHARDRKHRLGNLLHCCCSPGNESDVASEPNSSRRPSSSITATPSACALSSLEPASAPATT